MYNQLLFERNDISESKKIVEFASLFLGIKFLTGKECKYIQAISQSINGNRSTFNGLCTCLQGDLLRIV